MDRGGLQLLEAEVGERPDLGADALDRLLCCGKRTELRPNTCPPPDAVRYRFVTKVRAPRLCTTTCAVVTWGGVGSSATRCSCTHWAERRVDSSAPA